MPIIRIPLPEHARKTKLHSYIDSANAPLIPPMHQIIKPLANTATTNAHLAAPLPSADFPSAFDTYDSMGLEVDVGLSTVDVTAGVEVAFDNAGELEILKTVKLLVVVTRTELVAAVVVDTVVEFKYAIAMLPRFVVVAVIVTLADEVVVVRQSESRYSCAAALLSSAFIL